MPRRPPGVPPRPRGRPALPPGERLDRRVEIRVTGAEMEAIDRAAGVAGVDRSSFIREAAVGCAEETIGGAGVDKSTDME